MKVGFIGLGVMGRGMAHNLLKAGHEVTVYNRTRARAEELAREGARVAASAAETASGEVVITMLADDRALEEVLLGRGDLLAKLRPEQIHVSMSTISVELSRNLVEAHGRHGTIYVSAPVFGRPEVAEAGKLFIVAAGPKPAVAKCEPLFSAMGQRTFVLGEDAPAANVFKLSGNFLIMSTLESIGEAFALLRKYGMDPQQCLDILTNSFFTAPFAKNYGGIIAQEKYEPAGFSLRLAAKDVRLILAAADATNVPMPVAGVLRDRFLTGVSRGLGEKDWSAIAVLAAESAGLKCFFCRDAACCVSTRRSENRPDAGRPGRRRRGSDAMSLARRFIAGYAKCKKASPVGTTEVCSENDSAVPNGTGLNPSTHPAMNRRAKFVRRLRDSWHSRLRMPRTRREPPQHKNLCVAGVLCVSVVR